MAERKDQWSYANGKTPADYRCAKCSESGVRLYRQWNTFVEHIQLLCTACALQDQHKSAPDAPSGHTIGWLAAAVPCEERDTYWGHSSVPLSGVRWWERLPLRQEAKSNERGQAPDDMRKHCEFGGMAGPVADTTSRRVAAEECMQAYAKFMDEADKYHKQTEGYAWIAVEMARDAWLSLSWRWCQQQKGAE